MHGCPIYSKLVIIHEICLYKSMKTNYKYPRASEGISYWCGKFDHFQFVFLWKVHLIYVSKVNEFSYFTAGALVKNPPILSLSEKTFFPLKSFSTLSSFSLT